MLQETCNSLVLDEKITAPVVRFVTNQARKEINKAAAQSVIHVSLSRPLLPRSLASSKKNWNESRAEKYSKQRKIQSYSKSDDGCICSRRGYMKRCYKPSTSSSKRQIKVSNLVIDLVGLAFADGLDH